MGSSLAALSSGSAGLSALGEATGVGSLGGVVSVFSGAAGGAVGDGGFPGVPVAECSELGLTDPSLSGPSVFSESESGPCPWTPAFTVSQRLVRLLNMVPLQSDHW